MMANTTGHDNVSLGEIALISNISGNYNVAIGQFAVGSNTTGELDVGLGWQAGFNLTTGNNNIDIANLGVAGESNTIRIGEPVAVTAPGPVPLTLPAHTATYIAGISGTRVIGTPVVVKSDGQLGVKPSSERFKTDVRPMDKTSEAIFALQPVTFRYKKEIDADATPQFGLIAEEVEKINPALVAHDANGKPFTVDYNAVNSMLLNEFLKAHRTVEEQQKEITALRIELNEQRAELKAQRALIQKVSDEVELSKSAPQTVVSDQ
jgi:hypothetical protein